MLYLLIKAAISGVIVAVVSETARRSPGLGALIVSLPLASERPWVQSKGKGACRGESV